MSLTIKSSDVRSHWSEFMDDVIHRVPKFVQRNERDIFLSMNLEIMAHALESVRYPIQIKHDEEANEYIASIDGVWIIEVGETEEDAIHAYLSQFIEWAQEYFEEFRNYYNAPNLKAQFARVLKALVIHDVEGLKPFIDVEHI